MGGQHIQIPGGIANGFQPAGGLFGADEPLQQRLVGIQVPQDAAGHGQAAAAYGLPRDGLAGLPGGLLLGHFHVQAVIAGQVRDPEIAVHGKADGAAVRRLKSIYRHGPCHAHLLTG